MTGGRQSYLWGNKGVVAVGAQCLCLGLLCQFPPHISQLKSARELDKMKGLKLEELWLEENPFCDTFPDQSTYIRLVITTHPSWGCLLLGRLNCP